MEVTTTRAIIENKSGDGLTNHANGFPCERSQCKTNAIAGYALGEKRASRIFGLAE